MAVWSLYLSFFLFFVLDASEATPLTGTSNGTTPLNGTCNGTIDLFIDASTDDYQWSPHECRCFRFFRCSTSWSDAQKQCLDNNGHLASVHTDAEYTFVQKLITSQAGTSAEAWIGGYGPVAEKAWFWSDGSKMNLEIWATGEPNYKEERCILMNYGSSKKWNNWICHGERPFVCSRMRKPNGDC